MFLKSLTMKGFKSFADATQLDLEPGVTVVVGPNGSGKSNVVDAVAWVLGAQAPKAVRSQKMDDVIFAGTATRPALGRAEVSLTIDNSAGLLPVDFAEVTITRTLFRTGESEYQLNGVPCRLLDVQELLSDSGVGRQQHVIVSQGQIDAVLDARPEDRRAIIEEAAGVLKYRRRKEKAERRLAATEDNLVRVQDLLREVRRQLRPLERQADAARRHGDLVTELNTLKLHLAGRRITELRTRLATTQRSRSELEATERTLETELADLDSAVTVAETRVSSMGGHDLADQLGRVEGLRERARGLRALLAERAGGLQRELDASVDQGVIESLEAESARLAAELVQVETERTQLEPQAAQVQQAAAEIHEQRSLFDQEYADGPAQPSTEAAQVRGELSGLEKTLAQARHDDQRLRQRVAELGHTRSATSAASAELADDREAALADVEGLRVRLAEQEAQRESAEATLDQAEATLHQAEADRQSWTARADALSLALDDARARGGAECLGGLDGVLGALVELIDIDPGWEAAFEAAAGEALAAVVVTDTEAGKRAVEALRAGQAAGAVLALDAPTFDRHGLTGGGGLRVHVRSRHPGVDQLLDRLVGAAVVVDSWVEGIDLVLRHPGALVVTTTGDRFGPDGWRIGRAGSGATGAALEEALDQAEAAIVRLDRAKADVAAARDALEAGKRTVVGLGTELEAARARHEEHTAAVGRLESDRRSAETEFDAVTRQLAELGDRLTEARARHTELAGRLPALAAVEAEVQERNRQLDEARQQLESATERLSTERTGFEVRLAQVTEREQFLRTRLTEIDERLARHAQARAHAAQRRRTLEHRLAVVRGLDEVVVTRTAEIDRQLAELRTERQRQSDETRAAALQLEQLRSTRQASEKQLADVRARSQRAEIDTTEVTLKMEQVIESLRHDLDAEPETAVTTACPPLADGTSPSSRVRELERELRLMGPINPLALEEYEALQERHEFLQTQLDDVRGSRRELAKVIRAVDGEIVSVFAAAFADVAANFEKLFATLFPGGTGRLKLTNPDDLLVTGIEVEAKPSGKNVKKLSLLSGGERSLTALGFLFAVFRSRPSPFYVMDEVEAALDDVNLHRFLVLVQEFRDEAQLLIVSHQKRTMEAADCLYGISMQPGGSSRALSERVTADVREPATV